jgi:hypothetical protein
MHEFPLDHTIPSSLVHGPCAQGIIPHSPMHGFLVTLGLIGCLIIHFIRVWDTSRVLAGCRLLDAL